MLGCLDSGRFKHSRKRRYFAFVMMKAVRPSSAPRIHPGFVWLFVFCFNLTAYFAVSDNVVLQTKSLVSAKCGDTVNLTCITNGSQTWNVEMRRFFWQFKNKTCEYVQNHTDSGFQCGTTNTTLSHAITLTLHNIMPTDEGEYFCKLHSTKGSWNNNSQLRIQGCLANNKSSRNVSHAECLFEGVYPSGVVHWFQGNKNLTEVINMTETKDKHNRFNIRSAMKLKKGNEKERYNCSLWIPSLNRYLATLENSGCLIELQWICVVVMVIARLVM